MSLSKIPRPAPWSRRLLRRWRGLAAAPWVGISGMDATAERWWRGVVRRERGLQWSGRFCLLVLAALTAWSVGSMARRGGTFVGFAEPDGLTVILAGLVWVAGCAAASVLPLPGYAVAVFWLANHGLFLMGAWAGTPLMALPVFWLLMVGLALAWRRGSGQGWQAFAVWTGICTECGWLMAAPLRIPQLLRLPPGPAAEWISAGLVTALLIPAWWLRMGLRRRNWMEPTFGRVLAGSALMMGFGLGGGWFRNTAVAQGWAAGVFDSCRFAGMLAWYWLAGGFALSLLECSEWGTRQAVRALTLRVSSRIFPVMWAVVTLIEWLGSHPGAMPWLDPSGRGRLGNWMNAWPWETRVAAWGHAWAGVVALVTGAGFLWQGRDGVRLLPRLNALWVASFFCFLAVSPVLTNYLAPPSEPALTAGRWALLILLGGLASNLRQPMPMHSPEPSGESRRAGLGWWTVLLGVLLELARRGEAWPVAGGEAALLGILHLGLPRALHGWWTRGRHSAGALPVSSQILISTAGMVSVLPMLHRDPGQTAALALAPVLWLTVLLWLRWRRPALTTSAGALAGALLGSGAAAAWCRPGLLLPEVPIFPFLNAPSAAMPASRPFLDAEHFTLLLLLTAIGALLGALLFRQRPPTGEIPLAIAEPAA